ncbi:MAG: hypothetical protein BWK79_07445 [Beggiatoa sp. IS2]|nr:MAG: hypothetical protein BWK79_07445 [Beggiatoa sp. IS2]
MDDYALGYSIPLNRNDMTLTMSAERNTAKVIDEPFNRLNVKSEASTYALALSYPLRFFSGEQVSDRTRTLDIGLKMEKRYSKTFLLDKPFPFSPGVEGDDNRKGESHISVVRFSQDWLDRSRTQVIAARSSFNFGIDAFDATIHEDGSPDSHFFSWLGQFQWVKRLPFFDSQILFRTDFQWANQDLLPLEKISIGGATTVRGYRENQLTRDNGLISSVEWRMPIMRIPMPGLSKESEDGLLYFAPFADYGRAWNTDSDTPDPKDIYSVGFGLRWAPIPKVQAEVYWGKALQDIPDSPDNDLQDKGIHFEISVLW